MGSYASYSSRSTRLPSKVLRVTPIKVAMAPALSSATAATHCSSDSCSAVTSKNTGANRSGCCIAGRAAATTVLPPQTLRPAVGRGP